MPFVKRTRNHFDEICQHLEASMGRKDVSLVERENAEQSVFICKDRPRYSREGAAQTLPRVSTELAQS